MKQRGRLYAKQHYEQHFRSVNVIHSSGSRGKVLEEHYSISNLYGFKMKSPYSCTVNGCHHTYSYTALYHFQECNKCGEKSDTAVHTFIRVGMKYRCNFAVTDSMLLYKEIGVYSLETGELVQDTTTTYLMQPIPRDAHSFAAQFTEQGPSIIACVNKNSESPYDICCDFDYFMLDSDSGIWYKTETICREVASFSDEFVRFILNNGKEIAFREFNLAIKLVSAGVASDLVLDKKL